ncbi:Serine phosphatase RsbU, regulator of sigma subunit [hydrothermal vent metagenome]|uniref:Serine phosphatase RsbU, regulator of sigma subunit n=1 Tax=hydrothermal vent metagenome TaxID=652676 RepID=A0A3B0ZVA0_9ZZZZ
MSNTAENLSIDNVIFKGKALIVDDEPTNRLILQAHLSKQGYDIISAVNGVEAVEKFTQESPDIIFMDVMMPEMDGYEATLRIKSLCGDRFVPVIFLTAITDEDELAKCVAAGGDDFLTKPFSHILLKAKVDALERVRDLHREITKHHAQILHDEEVAEQLFSDVVMADNVELDKLHVMLRPAVTFSGDILMSARSPSGELYIILGDFTGHGLVAAIGALPTAEVFRAMTKKGFSLSKILKELNRKLEYLLPSDKFLAVGAISIAADVQSAKVWNGGIPSILHLNSKHEILNRFQATHLALGILDEVDDEKTLHVDLKEGDALVMYTDGVIEACDTNKKMYGEERFEKNLLNSSTDDILINIEKDLISFTGGHVQDDDISMVVIPCTTKLIVDEKEYSVKVIDPDYEHDENSVIHFPASTDANISLEWQWEFNVHSASLKKVDPIPVLLSQIQELEDIHAHRQNLFLIFSELFNNALDHGVLKLDSKMKADPDGFTEYLEQREQRLDKLIDANIEISLEKFTFDNDEYLKIRMKDSGNGFVIDGSVQNLDVNSKLSGRGINLVKELCYYVEYKGKGNEVEVVYQFS